MAETFSFETLELLPVGPDSTDVRSAFARFPSGVAALSGVVDGKSVVLVASSFQVGISADPPLVLFAVQHTSTSWPKLRTCARIGVSILSATHDRAARQLSSKSGDRFAGIEHKTTRSGATFIVDAALWLECTVYAETPAGDHDVVLLQVRALGKNSHADPLVWHGSTFRTLAATSTPEPASGPR